MKKVIVGCLIVLVIAMAGFAVAGYYAYRWAQPMIQSTADYLDRARAVSRLSDRVENKAPYVAPANGELTQAQVERFLAVQSRLRNELGSRWAEIEKKSEELSARTKNRQQLTFAEFTSVFSDLANIYLEARREQVKALNTHKFSDAEYAWVRRRVYEAAGIEITSGMDVSKIEQLARDNGISMSIASELEKARPQVPAANIKVVRPHLAKLKESFHLAMLGL